MLLTILLNITTKGEVIFLKLPQVSRERIKNTFASKKKLSLFQQPNKVLKMEWQGVYIFENETDFLQAMEQLNHQYWDKPTAIFLSKKLENSQQLNKEIAFLDKCNINSFNGFRTAKQIKISITDGLNYKYCVTYCFNSSNSGTIFDKLHRYLRKREQI